MRNKKLTKQRKKGLFWFLLFSFWALGLALPVGFLKAKTITVDGDFSDWSDVPTLVEKLGFTGSATEFSASGTTYYYNTSTNSWQTTEIAGACKVNYDYMINVDFIKMTNDNNYLYLLWERGTDFTNFRWDSSGGGGNYYIFSKPVPSSAPHNEFSETPPCAGHDVTAPANFDHDMVISIDKDKNGTYDYYLVINVTFPEGAYANGNMYETKGFILEDNGNGVYDGRSSETTKTTFGESGFEVGISAASSIGVRQEWRMSINQIFADLGLNWGDSVNVRYEAHSSAPSETTEAKPYTFERNRLIKLKVTAKKKVKKSSTIIKGTTVKGAMVRVIANNVDLGSIKTNKKGKFAKRVSLNAGVNTIRIETGHATKGSNSVTKTITRK